MAKDPFVKQKYMVGNIQIYPMLFEDSEIVAECFTKVNPDGGVGIATLAGEDSRNAVFELLKLATKLPDEKIKKIDIYQMQDIVDEYIGLSRLKKKTDK